nr:flagellar biosynthetic protein FliO [Bacillus piscicola]
MEERSLFAVFFQLIVALAVVIGLMYLLVKILNKRTKTFQAHQTMQNLGGVPLGQHKSIQLVKVGERLLVVGVGESIQLLTEIMNEEEINQLIERKQAPGESWGRQGFSFFDRFKQAGASNKNGKQDSFQDLFREQLHDLKKTRKKARQHLKEYDS